LGKADHLLRREIHALGISFLEDLLISPPGVSLSDHSPTITVGNSVPSNSDDFSFEGHLADALDDLQQFVEGGGGDIFEEDKIWHEEIVGEDEVMNRHGMRGFRGDGLSDVEFHAFVPDDLEGPVDGAIFIGLLLLFSPKGSHCS